VPKIDSLIVYWYISMNLMILIAYNTVDSVLFGTLAQPDIV